nr:hypothetical protein [Candidatus Enterousia merdequi]
MNFKKISFIVLCMGIFSNAYALDYNINNWTFKLDADGMIGTLQPKDEQNQFISDWDVKGQVIYKLNASQRLGAVYSIDSDCTEEGEYVHDGFILFEDKNYGRAEFGLTHSIARKMGLGLPDVGHLRLNEKSILYKKLDLNRILISDTTAVSGHESLRLNLATRQTEYGQYGLSFAAGGDDYDYAVDMAFKFKQPHGKLKSAYSLALSYMDKPNGYEENSYSPSVYADWRSQIALGINLQYNSLIWGTSFRMIYDKNPEYKSADGLIAGTGFSYDLLQYTVSLNYLFSDTNVWEHKDKITNEKLQGDYTNTVIASFRYKYSENTAILMSGGLADTTPFLSIGIKSGF